MMPLKEKQVILDVFVKGHRIHNIIRNGGVGVKRVMLMNVVTTVKPKGEDKLIDVRIGVTVAMEKGQIHEEMGHGKEWGCTDTYSQDC